MDEQRKQTIINEIQHWRKNQLLPEHYCIFLLNLYTEGESAAHAMPPSKVERGRSGSGKSQAGRTDSSRQLSGRTEFSSSGSTGSTEIPWKMFLYWVVGAVVIASGILFAFHFNELKTGMQICLFAFYILLFYLLAFVFRYRAPGLTHISLAISFLLLITGGVLLLQKANVAYHVLLSYLAIVCVLWLLNGLLFKFSYLLYCSIIGLGLIYGGVTTERLAAQFSWWLVELYWVPLALLMTGFGYMLHLKQPQLSKALVICGLLLFFGPEISSMYIEQNK